MHDSSIFQISASVNFRTEIKFKLFGVYYLPGDPVYSMITQWDTVSHMFFFFFWKTKPLITVKITENNLIFYFGFFYNSANIEFETLAMLYSDSARYFF